MLLFFWIFVEFVSVVLVLFRICFSIMVLFMISLIMVFSFLLVSKLLSYWVCVMFWGNLLSMKFWVVLFCWRWWVMILEMRLLEMRLFVFIVEWIESLSFVLEWIFECSIFLVDRCGILYWWDIIFVCVFLLVFGVFRNISFMFVFFLLSCCFVLMVCDKIIYDSWIG